MVHQFTLTGNFTATLRVSDGNHTAIATTLVQVAQAQSGTRQVVTGSWTAGLAGCGEEQTSTPFGATGYKVTPLDGKEWVAFTVRPDTVLKPFFANVTQAAPADPSGTFGYSLEFYTSTGTLLGNGFPHHDDGMGHITGIVDGGAATGVLFPCGTGPGSFTYTAG